MTETAPRPKVYLAGPGVFRPDAEAIGAGLKQLCAAAGLEGLWPGDQAGAGEQRSPGHDGLSAEAFRCARAIFDANVAMIAGCDAAIADVTPFRGPHLDVGTAFEIGYAAALGKPVIGYVTGSAVCSDGHRMRSTQLIDRVWCEASPTGHRDAHGDLVEDFGLVDNLMVAMGMRSQVVTTAQLAIVRVADLLRRMAVPQ